METDFFKIFISEKEIENNLYNQLSNLKINKESLKFLNNDLGNV